MGALAALVLVAPGCAKDVGSLVVFVSRSSQVQQDPLDPALVKYLRVRIEGPGMGVVSQTFKFTAGGSSSPPPVPVGTGRVITLEGLAGQGGPVVSRGQSLPVTIVPGRNEVELYMGLTGRFSSASGAGLFQGRFDATGSVLPSGQVLIAGGASGGSLAAPSTPVASMEQFDPTAGRVVAAGDCSAGDALCLGTPRFGQSAVVEGSAVVVVGGRDDQALVPGLERCDADGCGHLGTLKRPRWLAASASNGDTGYVVGGDEGSGPSAAVDAVTAGPKVAPAPTLPDPLEGASAAVLADGTLVVFGGQSPSGLLGDALVLAHGTHSYTKVTGTGTDPRRDGAAVTLADGRVLWIGGQDVSGASDEVDLYDPATGKLCPVGHLVRARWRLTAVRLDDGRVLVAGGLTGAGAPTAEAELLDPRFVPAGTSCQGVADTLESQSAPRLAHRRAGHVSVLLPNGLVMVAGGIDETGTPLKSIELYVPAS